MTATIWQRSFGPIKRLLPTAVSSRLRGVATGVLAPIRFSRRTGHWQSSMRTAACTPSGTPLPWYTYPAIDFLKCRDFTGRSILEFGGGQSTLWWAARAASVLTIEEDENWYRQLTERLPGNVTLHHVPVDLVTRSTEPVTRILDQTHERLFDVVVVDGHLRRELAVAALQYLTPDGAIVLDNAEGYGFYSALKDLDCRRIDFYGFAPGVSLRHCTSVVFRNDCFLLMGNIPIKEIEASD